MIDLPSNLASFTHFPALFTAGMFHVVTDFCNTTAWECLSCYVCSRDSERTKSNLKSKLKSIRVTRSSTRSYIPASITLLTFNASMMHMRCLAVAMMISVIDTGAFVLTPARQTSQRAGCDVCTMAKARKPPKDNLGAGKASNTPTDESFAFEGAGRPRPDLDPQDIPTLLMESLARNDFPHVDAGLESMWAFAGDTTRHIFQKNMTEFIESAHETADTMPTSFYGAAMYGKSWSMETKVNRVGGDDGWIATQVMKTICSDGRLRRWQWELRKNKRPPDMDCWFVESIGSSNRKGQFEAE